MGDMTTPDPIESLTQQTPYFIKVVQMDGHVVWLSPIYGCSKPAECKWPREP